MISQGFLGNLGDLKSDPPKLCAGLLRMLARGRGTLAQLERRAKLRRLKLLPKCT